ncbi:MAG: DUF2066 domain-containing protein [Pseudomonadota bacterium]
MCAILANHAHAQNALFTIDNVTVDVTAENALKAREQAFEQAQVKAFQELSARMLSEQQLQSFQTPELLNISAMIKDYEVSDEKLSSKRYIGTYKIRFQDRAVKRYFAQSGAEYTDIASQPILILPFLETDQGPVLWSYQNEWMQAWARSPKLGSGLVPIVLPLGDLTDVSDIGDDEALTHSKRSLDRMVSRYDASEAVIAIARPEGTGLSIQLYRTDRAQPEYVHQILERALPGQDTQGLYDRAVQSAKAALRQDWKKKTVVEPEQRGSIQVRVSFNSLQEWSNLQRSLSRVYGIADTKLLALSPREAYLELLYDGNLERLKLALQQGGLYLGAPRFQQASTAGLNADYSQGLLGTNGGAKAVYELSATRPVNSGNASQADTYGYQPPSQRPASSRTPSQYQTRF